MNRVQRRLWKAFLRAGGEITEPYQIDRFQRVIHDQIQLMPPALLRVMMLVLSSDGEVDYERLAAELVAKDRLHVSRSALRQRVSRAIRRLENIIRGTAWTTAPRTAIVFQRGPRDRYRGPSAPARLLRPIVPPPPASSDEDKTP
jgi:hypothetical protein